MGSFKGIHITAFSRRPVTGEIYFKAPSALGLSRSQAAVDSFKKSFASGRFLGTRTLLGSFKGTCISEPHTCGGFQAPPPWVADALQQMPFTSGCRSHAPLPPGARGSPRGFPPRPVCGTLALESDAFDPVPRPRCGNNGAAGAGFQHPPGLITACHMQIERRRLPPASRRSCACHRQRNAT